MQCGLGARGYPLYVVRLARPRSLGVEGVAVSHIGGYPRGTGGGNRHSLACGTCPCALVWLLIFG